MGDTLKLRSSIKSSLMRQVLFKGTLLAAIGGAILLFCGAFLSPARLTVWGFPIFLTGIGLIALGLIPFRKLRRLENEPDMLVLENHQLQFFSKGVCQFIVPLSAIKKSFYVDRSQTYGIALLLQDSLDEKIRVLSPKFDMRNFISRSQKNEGADLYFPYFSERSFQELEAYLEN